MARKLTFGSGGWVILLAVAFSALVGAAMVVPLFKNRGPRPIGDGRHVESYGFDLSTCLVPRGALAASGFPKDRLPALVAPKAVTADEAASLLRGRDPYVVSDDRVIGVAIGGEARAYPLSVLNWHEVVNDTLGGVPIAVTWNPLAAGVVVLDRRVEGRVLEFGVSGLLFQSNLLLYDREPGGHGESLWSQLQARAIAGPAAASGRAMATLPCSFARWADWRRALPGTTVILPPDPKDPKYRRDPYGTYFSGSRLAAPVDPYPPPPPLEPKTRVLVVEGPDWRRIVPLDGPLGADWKPDWPAGLPAPRIDRSSEPASVIVPPEASYRTSYAFWFAWYALREAATEVPGSHPDGASAK